MHRLLLALLLLAVPASAQELRIGVSAFATSADPQFYNVSANNNLADHIFGRLTQRGPDASLQPDLALSWTAVADTIWEFHLRPGVLWQDGVPFTADDVAFSFARAPAIPNSPSNFAGMLRAITQIEVVNPLTIRLHTARPASQSAGRPRYRLHRVAACRRGRRDGGLRFRARRHRHRPLSAGAIHTRRPGRSRSQRFLVGKAPDLGSRHHPPDRQSGRPHRRSPGRRCRRDRRHLRRGPAIPAGRQAGRRVGSAGSPRALLGSGFYPRGQRPRYHRQ